MPATSADSSPVMLPEKAAMRPLTLIVAATRTMGIGNKGQLPWPMLKHEMAYFARVTRRSSTANSRNVVIMGRKTWESIPPKFRPLKGRLNVVLSRSGTMSGVFDGANSDLLVEKSLESALNRLDSMDGQGKGENGTTSLEHLFVIGGGSIYAEALKTSPGRTTQLLLTKIKTDFECDTQFPLDPDAAKAGWERCSQNDLNEFVGEEVRQGDRHEDGVDYEFTLYRRRLT